jgi:hypothetical protein
METATHWADGRRKFDRTVAYKLQGYGLRYARKGKGESPMAAITRSVARALKCDQITIWFRDCRDGHDIHEVQWFDAPSDTFRTAELELERVS